MKILLYPWAWLYWIITFFRNKFFDWKVFHSVKYNIPVICVGNLSVGGTGKSPMVIYLSEILKNYKKVAVISRGYGRATKGLLHANYDSTYKQIGDEAMQLFQRLRNKIVVAVDENRIRGINYVIKNFDADTIILDDAFQHRKVKAGFNILLTDFNNLYTKDYILPVGRLREGKYGARRADIVVVTKCPANMTQEQKDKTIKELKIKSYQRVFFSQIVYSDVLLSFNSSIKKIKVEELNKYEILLMTGIAKYTEVLEFCNKECKSVVHMNFADHHDYSDSDIAKAEKKFETLNDPKLIITTEKDYMRLKHFSALKETLYYLPVNTEIDNPEEFKQIIIGYADGSIPNI